MDPAVTALVVQCRAEVLASSEHEFSFRTRRRLLLSLGAQVFNERNSAVEMGPGKRRRVVLALEASRRVVLVWERDYGTRTAADLLDAVQAYLAGALDHAALRRRVDSFQGALSNDHLGKDEAYLAGRAAAATGWVGVHDELLSTRQGLSEEELDEPDDPDMWDPAYFAAGSAAGGMPWSAGFDANKYLAFWLWYLDTAVPKAWSVG